MNPQPQIEQLETNLLRLSKRLPDTPVTSVMLTRMLLYVGRGMAELLEQQIRPFGLAEAEFRVLTTLYSQPEGVSHPGDLCVSTSQRPANMSRICDSLVNRNLITRVPSAHDRRRLVLRITEQGAELVQRLLPVMFARLRDMFKDIPDPEQRRLIELLKGLTARLDVVMTQLESELPAAESPP